MGNDFLPNLPNMHIKQVYVYKIYGSCVHVSVCLQYMFVKVFKHILSQSTGLGKCSLHSTIIVVLLINMATYIYIYI